jgi:hypothetical protein
VIAFGLLVAYAESGCTLDAIGYPSPDRRVLAKPLKAPDFIYTFVKPTVDSVGSLPLLSTEVLVIGSGSGGGVAASRLAPQHRTLIVEKGVYAPTGEKLRGQLEAFNELYQNGGFIGSESGTMSVLAASVFGGGSAINWSASFKTQHYVREEWAKEKGLSWFLSDGYTQALDHVSHILGTSLTHQVCRRMGVASKHIKHSVANQKLLDGSVKLGFHADAIPVSMTDVSKGMSFKPMYI